MNVNGVLPSQLVDAGEAIGLIKSSGSPGDIRDDWFGQPFANGLATILSDSGQRAALFRLLDDVLPPEAVDGAPGGAKWHPLLGAQTQGNVYLTVDSTLDPNLIGFGARYSGSAASLVVQIPALALSGSSLQSVIGTQSAPIRIALNIPLGWSRADHPFALDAVSVEIALTPALTPPGRFTVTLNGLDLDGTGPGNYVLDPNDFGSESTQLIIAFIQAKLHALSLNPGSAGADVLALATHLLPLLGLDGTLPRFPFATLATDPLALKSWLKSLVSGSNPPVIPWLESLAGLLGVTAPVATTTTSGKDLVTSLSILSSSASMPIDLSLALVQSVAADGSTPTLGLRVVATAAPGASSPASLKATVDLFAVPLSGSAAASILPRARVSVVAPGSGVLMAAAAGKFSVDALEAGFTWDGAALAPSIQLTNVVIPGGGSFPVIDLSNANSVATTAAGGLVNAVISGLGANGAAARLASLAGLIKLASNPAAPLVDVVQLASRPGAAMAALHRNALISTTLPWSMYLAELGAMLSLPGTVSGQGTPAQPWSLPLASSAQVSLALVAWNDQTSGVATDTQKLRLGLSAQATSGPSTATWTSVLLSADLPASGANSLAMFAQHQLDVSTTPAPVTAAGLSLSASAIDARFTLLAGSAAQVQGAVSNLSLTTPAGTLSLPTLPYPFPPASDPASLAAALHISLAQLEHLAASLLQWAAGNALGPVGKALSVALGCGGGLPGLPADLPSLADVASGQLLSDPAAAWRAWIAKVVTTLSGTGSDFATPVMTWVQALLANTMGADASFTPDPLALSGTGTYDDPWALPLSGANSPAEAIVWLEPAGPGNAAALAATALAAASDFPGLAGALSAASRYLGALPSGLAPASLASGLTSLASHVANSDGVVPLASQQPSGGSWGSGTALTSAHPDQPEDPSAIQQILAQVDAWAAPASPRGILLLGPAFSDHGIWAKLQAAAEAAHPGATGSGTNFNLRQPGLSPASIDLRSVTAVCNYYSADLQDDGSGNLAGLVAQIGLVLARLRALLPAGAPIILVAHSTAGLAACAYCAANAGSIQGLVTLGSPLQGAPLPPLTDAPTADALRFVGRLFPGGAGLGAMQSTVAHLLNALDGYLAPASAGALPVSWPYPIADFSGLSSLATGGTPALALGGKLGGGVDLLATLKAALGAKAGAFVAAAPTHLSVGVRAHLNGGGSSGSAPATSILADTTLRLDAGRIPLQPGATAPARPAQALTASVKLYRQTGWLVGDPRSYAGAGNPLTSTRVRSARLGLVLTPNGATLSPQLDDVAINGITVTSVTSAADALLQPALGAIFGSQGIAAQTLGGTSLGNAVALLQALGVVTVPASPGASFGVAADALNALDVDPLGFLTPKIPALFASGLLPGFVAATPAGNFTYALGGLPLEVFVSTAPGAIGLRTVGTGGLPLGPAALLNASISLAVSGWKPTANLALTAGPLGLGFDGSSLVLQVPSLSVQLPLVPAPSATQAAAASTALLPPLLLSSAVSALVTPLLPAGASLGSVTTLLRSPRTWLVQTSALGNGSAFDPARINALIARLGPLPAGLQVSASGSSPTSISASLGAALGGVLGLSASMTLESNGHAVPAAALSVTTPTSGTWPSVSATLAISASGGLTLALAPAGLAPIQILPTFDGAAALAGASAMLLPQALDALVAALSPPPPLVPLALAAATKLGVYGSGGFAAYATQLAAMTKPGWFATAASNAPAFASAAAAFFNDTTSPLKGQLPGTVTASGSTLAWHFPLPPAAGAGSLDVAAGWDSSQGPALSLGVSGVALANGPVTSTLKAQYSLGKVGVTGSLALTAATLDQAIGVAAGPELDFSFGAGAASLTLLPLGTGTGSILSVQLAPSFLVQPAPSSASLEAALATLAETWALPLAADAILGATSGLLSQPLYHAAGSGAAPPSVAQFLLGAGLLKNTGTASVPSYVLVQPLPDVKTLVASLLKNLPPQTIQISADPPLGLVLGSWNGELGVGLTGSITVSSGPPAIALLFAAPPGAPAGTPGVWLGLLTDTLPTFTPKLHLSVAGLGAQFSGAGDAPLISEAGVRIGDIAGFVAFDFDFASTSVSHPGAGLNIGALGLPLNLLDSAGSSNPVASSLVGSNGGSGGGDAKAVNPAVDVSVTWLGGQLAVQLAGTDRPVVIPVHANFGPVYIEQIDLALDGTSSVTLGIDGSVSISGLSVGVDELALKIPVASILAPRDWSIDLQGLAIGLDEGPVVIAGGLRKNPGPPIEYDGMLTASIEELGFTVVGAYSQPSDAQGSFTSLFMFAVLLAPLGGPPMAFVTGLGGGFGYNRSLKVPDDVSLLDSFVLVQAMDDDSLANDPMNALINMGVQIPARRGSLWIAAGARITSFALVNSVVVVSIALDRGLDIEILGLSRMALPDESSALVSVELALKARFNSAEQILSIQAQLTDNSYLFSRDCQLTGGFAFFVWYGQGQFVLTLGGYNPQFTVPAQFPNVPRLGFNWHVDDLVVIKGGAYFALTNSCVMAGGSISATANIGPVSAWFDAHLDFLVCWDPFSYEFDIGVEVGASVSVQICFFGCVTIGISLSLGAELSIAGPPFHGTASIDVCVTTITVSFGNPPSPPPYLTDWAIFAKTYLTAGDPNASAVHVQVSAGLLPTDPPGASPQPGSATQPWQVGGEFSLSTTTRMPATRTPGLLLGTQVVHPASPLNSVDLAAMNLENVTSEHAITLETLDGGGWIPATVTDPAQTLAVTALTGFFPEAAWHYADPQHLPAAARTITAISGLRINATVYLQHRSLDIPIASLVDDQAAFAHALPFFTTATSFTQYQSYGAAADTLAALAAAAGTLTIVSASENILASGALFSTNRSALGLNPAGLSPLALQALARSRAAPPLVTPLSTGLTMAPGVVVIPVLAEKLPLSGAILLATPRLRSVLQSRAAPMTDAPIAQHTSVAGVLPSVLAQAPRMAPPGLTGTPAIAGARLVTVPAPTAPRPTQAATLSRAHRHADLGAMTGPAHQQVLDQAASDLVAGGVSLGAGALHLWDVPSAQGNFVLNGGVGARLVCLGRSGVTLSDIECSANGNALSLPAGTAMVAVSCLGDLPSAAGPIAPAFGAISLGFSPTGQAPVVGWQSGSTLLQVGPAHFLARGAGLRVIAHRTSQRNGQRASNGTLSAALALAGQAGVETRLPTGIGVILVSLDVLDSSVLASGDLGLGVLGATLAGTAQRISIANRLVLLYDVLATDPKAEAIFVSIASASTYRLSGVMGMHGHGAEWAQTLSAGLPDHFVPDGALCASGALQAQFRGGV